MTQDFEDSKRAGPKGLVRRSDHQAVDFDAFASGQITSKLWLCEKLEPLWSHSTSKPAIVWILCGWYGLSGFLLLARQRMAISHVRSFDIDPNCQRLADRFNENWVWRNWTFKAFTADCHQLDYFASSELEFGPTPDIVINTSTEHLEGDQWWKAVPSGTLMALQSCNMPHVDHHTLCQGSKDLALRFPMSELLYDGEITFKYPKWGFSRFMTIGRK